MFIEALEVWGRGRHEYQTRVIARNAMGAHKLWHGEVLPAPELFATNHVDGRLVPGAELGGGWSRGLTEEPTQSFSRTDAARNYLGRHLSVAIGGVKGWHPVVHSALVVEALLSTPDRFRQPSLFNGVPSAPSDGPAADTFAQRLKERREATERAERAAAQAAREAELGVRTIVVPWARPLALGGVLFAGVPCRGTFGGTVVEGFILSATAEAAVVEVPADVPDVVITWAYGTHIIGTSASN